MTKTELILHIAQKFDLHLVYKTRDGLIQLPVLMNEDESEVAACLYVIEVKHEADCYRELTYNEVFDLVALLAKNYDEAN